MQINLLDISPQHEPILAEIKEAIDSVLRTNRYILGPEVTQLEENVAQYSGCQYGIGVSSGTDALLIALMGLDIGPGDEVITSTFSFFATAGVIVRLGAKPVFADIEADSFNIDPHSIESLITSKTKAILPVHLYGQCADMQPINEIAARNNLAVIEDAAQAIGSEYRDNSRAGCLGTVGCFSFFPSKNLGAIGDAGMVTTNDAALADKIRILRVHGGERKYYHSKIGGNFRIDAIQAAVLNVKLKYLDSWTKQRQKNAELYKSLFQASSACMEAVVFPKTVYKNSGCEHYHIYNQYIIRAAKRDELRVHLSDKGIANEIYYPVPFHMQECFEELGYKQGDFPEAEKAAAETVSIPVYPGMTEEQIEYVVNEIDSFYS